MDHETAGPECLARLLQYLTRPDERQRTVLLLCLNRVRAPPGIGPG